MNVYCRFHVISECFHAPAEWWEKPRCHFQTAARCLSANKEKRKLWSNVIQSFSGLAEWLPPSVWFPADSLACSQRLPRCAKSKGRKETFYKQRLNGIVFYQRGSNRRLKVEGTSWIWFQTSLSRSRDWIQLIRRSDKSMSAWTGAAVALYKRLELENPTQQSPGSLCRRPPLCPLPPFTHHTWAGIFASDLASICVKHYWIYPQCPCSFRYIPFPC